MINTIINIDKDSGITSTSVDKNIKKIIGTKKIGHVGTLDPLATGILPIFIGQATRLINFMNDRTKEYLCDLELGFTSTTFDTEGEVTKVPYKLTVSNDLLESVVSTFIGETLQVPPIYSSVKVNGHRAYSLARKGIQFNLEAKRIYIEDVTIIKNNMPTISLSIKCNEGVYIRSLVHDIGEKLKCGAVLTKLRRTKSGIFDLNTATTLEHLSTDNWKDHTIPIDHIIKHLPRINTNENERYKLSTGQAITKRISDNEFDDQSFVRCYDYENMFIGIAQFEKNNNLFLPHKIFI